MKSLSSGLLWFACLAIILVACDMFSPEESSGTGTGTENTVAEDSALSVLTGTIVDIDSMPVPGARVLLKQANYLSSSITEHDLLGQLGAKATGQAMITDSLGSFSFLVSRDSVYFVETIEGTGKPLMAWIPNIKPDRDTVRIPPATALPAGILEGRLVASDVGSDQSLLWVAIRGTNHFSTVDSSGAFRLAQVAPGTHTLTIVRASLVPGQQALHMDVFTVDGWRVFPGKASILDSVVLASSRREACLARLDSIAPLPPGLFPDPARAGKWLQSIRMQDSASLIYLDVCLGHWWTARQLADIIPGEVQIGILDKETHVVLPEHREIYTLRSNHYVVNRLGSSEDSLLALAPHAGTWFALYHADGKIWQYEGFAALADNSPIQFHLGALAGSEFMTSGRAGLYIFGNFQSDNRFYSYDPSSSKYQPAVVLSDYEGQIQGVAFQGDERLWILGEDGVLMEFDSTDGSLLQSIPIHMQGRLRGLSRVPVP